MQATAHELLADMQQRAEVLSGELQQAQSAHKALEASSAAREQKLQEQVQALRTRQGATEDEAAHVRAQLTAMKEERALLQATSSATLKEMQDARDNAHHQLQVWTTLCCAPMSAAVRTGLLCMWDSAEVVMVMQISYCRD